MVHLIHTRLTVLPRSKHKKRVPTQFSILPNHRKPIKILAKTKQATMKHITNHLITRQDISKQLLVSLNGLSWPCPQWGTEETQATTGGHNPSWHNPHFVTKWNSNPLLFYKIKHQEKKTKIQFTVIQIKFTVSNLQKLTNPHSQNKSNSRSCDTINKILKIQMRFWPVKEIEINKMPKTQEK